MIKLNIANLNLFQIAESGQCFRFNQTEHGYRTIAEGKILDMCQESPDSITLNCSKEDYKGYWHDYLDLSTDYASYISAIPSNDSFMTEAAIYGSGIRILRQPLFETLISFIISQRKSIPAIKTSIEAICRMCGNEIDEGIYAFPTPEQLASCSMEEILSCSVGYRARYILSAARSVAQGKTPLEELHKLDDDDVFKALLEFDGVGVKVANCVRLFGYHRLAAFPEDVWIINTINNYYGGKFPLDLYEGFAGVMQQYMFFYARSNKLGK